MLKEGDLIPNVDLRYRHHHNQQLSVAMNDVFGEWRTFNTHENLKDKRVVIFALPGAFTPTCGQAHAPKFENNYSFIRKRGIDEVYCTAVNDPFVLDMFKKKTGSVFTQFLPDGNGEFANGMGYLCQMRHVNYGPRSWRYSMVVDNLKIEKLFLEPGFPDAKDDPYGPSSAEVMLGYLEEKGIKSEWINPYNEYESTNDIYMGDVDNEKFLKQVQEDTAALRIYRQELEEVLKEDLGEEKYLAFKKERNDNLKKWGYTPILEEPEAVQRERERERKNQ